MSVFVCIVAYPMLDVMVAADQGCGCSDLLFRREVGIWKTTWRDRKMIGYNCTGLSLLRTVMCISAPKTDIKMKIPIPN